MPERNNRKYGRIKIVKEEGEEYSYKYHGRWSSKYVTIESFKHIDPYEENEKRKSK